MKSELQSLLPLGLLIGLAPCSWDTHLARATIAYWDGRFLLKFSIQEGGAALLTLVACCLVRMFSASSSSVEELGSSFAPFVLASFVLVLGQPLLGDFAVFRGLIGFPNLGPTDLINPLPPCICITWPAGIGGLMPTMFGCGDPCLWLGDI